MASMKIGSKIIGDGFDALMFAEEGQANQGDVNIAINMCKIAADSGADGIEFQFFLAKDMYIKNDPGYQIYKNRELSATQIKEIISACHGEGLVCQVAGLSPKIIELTADAGADIFCVNATDLNNPYIIDAVVSTKKPFWLATLMGTLEEIDWSVNYAKSKSKAEIGILHGQHVMSSSSTKGVPPELLQLDCIDLLRQRYGLVTGFVDHTASKLTPSLAVTKGASLVTKHLAPTINWEGPDSEVCLDPKSWREAKEMFNYAIKTNGNSKEISQAEFKDRSVHRRSIFTKNDLKAGHLISLEDLVALRPGKGGIDPKFAFDLVGKKLLYDLPAQHQIQNVDLK